MTDSATPAPPDGLAEQGRALWSSVVDDFELDVHELLLLRQACRTADLIERLDEDVEARGVTVESPQGEKTNPSIVEARQQRIALARLLSALRMPSGETGPGKADSRPQRRMGVRKPYGITGVVS
jgi:hypothetical protein